MCTRVSCVGHDVGRKTDDSPNQLKKSPKNKPKRNYFYFHISLKEEISDIYIYYLQSRKKKRKIIVEAKKD